MTASTLYEALEPQVVWKQLLKSIVSEITGEEPRVEAIRMTKFLLETFQVQDEEVQTIHLPIVFSAISESIRVRTPGFRHFATNHVCVGVSRKR
jgi:hypothetical protein